MDIVSIGADWVGRVIDGRYPLLQWLGGSDGSGVFLTELDGSGSQKVAIKVVTASYASAQAQLSRWAEAAELSHPHLMKLLRTGRCRVDSLRVVYSVTEYAEEVLADILQERALKPEEVNEMLMTVLEVLLYLHGKGYVHGHLKPSNILVVGNRLQVSGDGLLTAGEPGKWFRALTVYDAPETGKVVMVPAADVWSLGMVLVAALTQKPAEWDRESRKDPEVPAEVQELFARMARECLRINAERRCMLTDLNKARLDQVHAGGAASGQSHWVVEAKRADAEIQRRGRMVIVSAAVVAVALAIFWMVHLVRSTESGPAQTPAVVQTKAAGSGGTVGAVKASPAATRAVASSTQKASEPAVPMAAAAGRGAVVQRVLPEAPQNALDTIRGTVRVWIRVAVDASGNVTGATFQNAGPSKYFARLAMEAAQKWRFAPGAAGARRLAFEFRQTGVAVVATKMGQ
ncbi:MAG TPA: TonB family protein [Acidobacteriaceae bacterium]|nr:TonB family protein [Acidobacteriaceae bacterium]